MSIAILLVKTYLALALGSLFVLLLWAWNEELERKGRDAFAATDTGTEATAGPTGEVADDGRPTSNVGSADNERMEEPSRMVASTSSIEISAISAG